jgi:hypothetical protein
MQAPARQGAPRQQRSLWLRPEEAAAVERLRAVLDPVQRALIPAHVTLCRDEETAALSLPNLRQRLAEACIRPFALRFGAPQPLGAHGWLLPCVDGASSFQALRRCVLGGLPGQVQHAHLTLAHPCNPRAAGNPPGRVPVFAGGYRIWLDAVYWIEQAPPAPWRIVQRMPLPGRFD